MSSDKFLTMKLPERVCPSMQSPRSMSSGFTSTTVLHTCSTAFVRDAAAESSSAQHTKYLRGYKNSITLTLTILAADLSIALQRLREALTCLR